MLNSCFYEQNHDIDLSILGLIGQTPSMGSPLRILHTAGSHVGAALPESPGYY
ncbi:MAG: hypothetical protein ACYTFA_15240 [Planctomycetota bacterium]